MARYFRIQPAGLGIDGHYSTTSNDEQADGLHVFDEPNGVLATDGDSAWYGDEVVVIEGGESWANGDVEGECIDPSEASIIAKYSLEAFVAHFWPDLDDGEEPDGFNVRSDWRAA